MAGDRRNPPRRYKGTFHYLLSLLVSITDERPHFGELKLLNYSNLQFGHNSPNSHRGGKFFQSQLFTDF